MARLKRMNSLAQCYFEERTEEFEKLLAEGASPNCRVSDEAFAELLLFQAISDGKIGTVRSLLSYGASVIDTEKSITAVTLAVFHGNSEVLDLLLETRNLEQLEIVVNASDPPILAAVKRRNLLMVRYLVDRGFDINARNSEVEGHTPLEYSVRSDDVEMVQTLLSLGAHPNARGLSNFTAIESAQESSQPNSGLILRMLTSAIGRKGSQA